MSLAQKIRRRNEIKAQIDALEKRLQKLDESIKEKVEEAGNSVRLKVDGDYYSVSYIEGSRLIWDSKKLEKALGAKADKYKCESHFSTLRVRSISEATFLK